jgi:hypothetical protein
MSSNVEVSISERSHSSQSQTEVSPLVQLESKPTNDYSFFSKHRSIDREYLNRPAENDSCLKCTRCCVLQ